MSQSATISRVVGTLNGEPIYNRVDKIPKGGVKEHLEAYYRQKVAECEAGMEKPRVFRSYGDALSEFKSFVIKRIPVQMAAMERIPLEKRAKIITIPYLIKVKGEKPQEEHHKELDAFDPPHEKGAWEFLTDIVSNDKNNIVMFWAILVRKEL